MRKTIKNNGDAPKKTKDLPFIAYPLKKDESMLSRHF